MHRFLPAMIALVMVLFQSCSRQDPNTLYVTSRLPSGVVARTAALSFTFSRAVVPIESTNVWTETSLITFTPPIEGRFVWSDTSNLIFSPDAALPGDRTYSGRLNAALLTDLAKAPGGFSGDEAFEFSTEQFRMVSAEFFYDRVDNKREVGMKANVSFSYEVLPEDLTKALRVEIDGTPHPNIALMTSQRSKVFALEIRSVPPTNTERTITIECDDELVSPETGTTLNEPRSLSFKLPRIDELKIFGHEFGYDGKRGWIRLKMSQEVPLAGLSDVISVEPKRTFTIDRDGTGALILKGNFEPGTTFRLTVQKGLKSYLDVALQNDYSADIVIGNVAPSFAFAASRGTYMLNTGNRTLELKTVNVDAIVVRGYQIFYNNLVHFLDGGRSYDYDWYEDEEEGYSYKRKFRYNVGNNGRTLGEKQMPVKKVTNVEVMSLLDLGPWLRDDYRGCYLFEIADKVQPWKSTAKLVVLTDLGIIVKRSKNALQAFVVSLADGKPVRGAKVSLVSTSNQITATAETDGDGRVDFDPLGDALKGFTLRLVVAEKDDDYCFIDPNDHRIETSRFDVGGEPQGNADLDAFLYGDRTLYRPGEKLLVAGIIRRSGSSTPSGIPVRIAIFNPRGSRVADLQKTLNEQGMFELEYQTSSSALTGEYRLDVRTGDDIFLSSYRVSVEDFVPDRMRVKVTPDRERVRPGDKISYQVLALNFFGPPAAGRNVEFEGRFDHAPFRSKRYPDYRFTNDAVSAGEWNPVVKEGRTNNEGLFQATFDMPDSLDAPGVLIARGRMGVFDESGRPVYASASAVAHPRLHYIGLLNPNAYYVSPRTPMRFSIVAVDTADSPVSGITAKVEVIRQEWHSVLRMQGSNRALRYVSERREIVESSQTVTLTGDPTTCTFRVERSGDYLVRVRHPRERGHTQFQFYAYSGATSDATSFEIDPEARVDIVLDKKSYEPGEKARALFQTPFSGTLLVTVERDRVYEHQFLEVKENTASMDIAVKDVYLPNVYVSAVLFRSMKELSIPLTAGHGIMPLFAEHSSNRLAVNLEAPQKIRPRTKQRVRVSVPSTSSAMVTLAAVDEGILQIKRMLTPDPYGFFYKRRALSTETFDFFRDLIPESKRPSDLASSTGGGDDESIARRANPLGVRRFKPLSLWSGIVKLDANGSADVDLDVPEFNGELRLMAMACEGDRYGSTTQAMTVTDPVVITPGLPRFMSPGDLVTMPITANNTTAKPVTLRFEIDGKGPVSVLQSSASLEVGPNQEQFVAVALKAAEGIGKGSVRVRTRAFGDAYSIVNDIPIRPIVPYTMETANGFAPAGTTTTVQVPDVFYAEGRRGHIVVSQFPVASFAKELKSLVGYPHGCLEQTTSKAFPQIYLRDIALLLDPSILESGSPTYFVNEAITKITSMQLTNGSFAYWPGGEYSNSWASVYATHFLVEAQKAGYAVPEGVLSAALGSVSTVAHTNRTIGYTSYENGRAIVRQIADKTAIYALYILALAGKGEQELMSYYQSNQSLLSMDTRFLLAAAFALSGDRKSYRALLPPAFTPEEAGRTSGGCYDSPIRANALILNVLLDTDPNNPLIARYLDHVSALYKRYQWYSTQDNAFTLLGVGKAARLAGKNDLQAAITIGGKKLRYDGGTKKYALERFGVPADINVTGEGRLYYSIVTEGIRKDGTVRIEDSNLRVRREFFDRSGSRVGLDGIKQNSLIVVKITVASDMADLENVAVSDLLPAGFEIENPRLTEEAEYSFITDSDVPIYVDIRDDRINYYFNFDGGRQKTFYYLVRAVSRGEFQYAPIVAEAMYDGNFYSASGGGKVRIVE